MLLQGGRWRTVAGQALSAPDGAALRARLRAAGYPADLVLRQGQHEVRINQLATQAVLTPLRANAALGLTGGRVALAAE